MRNEKHNLLKERIEKLKENFYFEQADGNITSLQEDYIRAFRLLCHAEIESFIEDLAITLLEQGVLKWNSDKLANYNLVSLFIWFEKIEKNSDTNQKANLVFSKFRDVVKSNHGIKEENIKKLFVPLGYSIDEFDNIFIANISSFGASRGIVAHSNASNTAQQLNFTDEKIKVDNIITGLVQFQNKLIEKE